MIVNSKSLNKEIRKGLYLVSTPIGNLRDITFRAIEILKESDYILCEDTRITKNLLKKYGIQSKLISNHKFNERKNLSKILKFLEDGLVVSLVSDAGTPGISDPGSILIEECAKKKYAKGGQLWMRHVKGHSGDRWNDRADALADRGRRGDLLHGEENAVFSLAS